jgi:hypothetical protein
MAQIKIIVFCDSEKVEMLSSMATTKLNPVPETGNNNEFCLNNYFLQLSDQF